MLLSILLIVNILGSIDDKIENNEKIIKNLEDLQLQIFRNYENNLIKPNELILSDIIKFVKGKKPTESQSNLMNYLSIEGITTNIYTQNCATNMILANNEDILMVMDGASSGTIYIGNKGIVASTLAKIEIKNNEYRYLIFQKLKQMEKKIKELNTGSAIPHANKEFIGSIVLCIDSEYKSINLKLQTITEKIIKIKQVNYKLSELKNHYLQKFFG